MRRNIVVLIVIAFFMSGCLPPAVVVEEENYYGSNWCSEAAVTGSGSGDLTIVNNTGSKIEKVYIMTGNSMEQPLFWTGLQFSTIASGSSLTISGALSNTDDTAWIRLEGRDSDEGDFIVAGFEYAVDDNWSIVVEKTDD